MPALAEYSNVYNTALIILTKKGFRVWVDEKSELYYAEKDGWDFAAESPLALLGAVAIYELKKPQEYSEYWWEEKGEDLYQSLSKDVPSYIPVYR